MSDAIDLSRRRFLSCSGRATAGAFVAALAPPGQSSSPQRGKTRLVLLGTAGGPRPKKDRSAPAQVIAVEESIYVVDCGNGVARQMVRAGLSLTRIRGVFITHQHSDHNADYGNLLWLAWASGLGSPVATYGPPPLARMTELFFQMNAYDIETRIRDEGRPPFAPLVQAHEITTGGPVFRDERVRVTAALVDHPPVVPALAYRFDGPERSIVISGDTARSEALVELARGADVLVHEALYPPAVDRLVAQVPGATRLKEHILASHTPVEEAGRIAAAAGVKTLVLSHFVPADDPSVTAATWKEAARAYFKGEVIVGEDLMEI